MVRKFDQEFKDRVVRLVESRVTSEGVSIRAACWGGSQARNFASPRKCGINKHVEPGKSVKPRKTLSASLQSSAGKIKSFVTRMSYLKLLRFFRLGFSGVFLLNRPIMAGF
ncbi:hypothetical protein HMPREF0580_1743 [Mobiluncus mulieris ATCC 35239]|uniref:Transposase n=1 Tax=Mobiluncus mulieris ATCC 35239 TaxID=871571 RepID=E0QS78_9ACTO|nr:hypothetical protein HMPREF0580_1743 [Mobiluncus mulieris ATCC 35239]